MDRQVRISKSLLYLLRHGAVKEKLDIDENGYIQVSKLLNHNRLKCNHTTLDDIKAVVETNNKKRFDLKFENDQYYICATQGHSINISDNNLTKLQLDEIPDIFHGTYQSKLQSIKLMGLSKMNRNHIHLTNDLNYIRPSANLLIYIDVKKCVQDGMVFYKSKNNVYLTEGIDGVIPSEYLSFRSRN